MSEQRSGSGKTYAPGRVCWSCKYFLFQGGEPDRSDITPGYEGSLVCSKEVWKSEMRDIDHADDLRKLLTTAEWCDKFKQRDH